MWNASEEYLEKLKEMLMQMDELMEELTDRR
jgi:hypothetical protein